jgi:hypothetical protein
MSASAKAIKTFFLFAHCATKDSVFPLLITAIPKRLSRGKWFATLLATNSDNVHCLYKMIKVIFYRLYLLDFILFRLDSDI